MNKVEKRKQNREKIRMMTYHHILNKCRSDIFNVFQEKNKVPMNRLEHDQRHIANKNEHPLETLQKQKFFTQVMSKRARELYNELISMDIEEFYDNQFIV